MHWLRNIFHRERSPIPDVLWADCIARLHFLQGLPGEELARLRGLCGELLHRKRFTGAAGFVLDDDVALSIAAQACLPVLNLTLSLYDDMAGVIVYPAQFILPQSEVDEAGVVHEWREPVSGEAIGAGGAVVLSWEDAAEHNAPGFNVVIHEFAHKIDMKDGLANGCPPFLAQYHRGMSPARWKQVFSEAYEDFAARVDRLDARLPPDFDEGIPAHAARYDALFAELPMDSYAARHPAEFFAVASEAFFVLPEPLAEDYPEVYELLSLYYRQDPLAR